jgi:hypothetical protein
LALPIQEFLRYRVIAICVRDIVVQVINRNITSNVRHVILRIVIDDKAGAVIVLAAGVQAAVKRCAPIEWVRRVILEVVCAEMYMFFTYHFFLFFLFVRVGCDVLDEAGFAYSRLGGVGDVAYRALALDGCYDDFGSCTS